MPEPAFCLQLPLCCRHGPFLRKTDGGKGWLQAGIAGETAKERDCAGKMPYHRCHAAALLCCYLQIGHQESPHVRRVGKGTANGSDAVLFSLSSACCGQLQVRMAIVEVRDWFGLWRFPLSVSAERSVPVLPRLHEVRIDLTETENWTASGQKNGGSRQKTGEPDSEIREYVPGDPVRQIHWKLSAKTDRLLLRENELRRHGIALMLETALAAQPKDMDAAVEGLLSASYALAQAAFQHDVCWYDHGSGELKWVEVETAREYDRLQKAILNLLKRTGGKPGEIFKSHYPHAHPARVIVFSPHAFSDVTSLLAELLP